MNIQVFKFFAEEEHASDYDKLFYWFMTKILRNGGITNNYTIANYDLKLLLRGHGKAIMTKETLPESVSKFFDVFFVTEPRQVIRLNKHSLSYFRVQNNELLCSSKDVVITDPKVQRVYLYLLGVFAGSNSMYYDDKYYGLGDFGDKEYHSKTRNLSRLELFELINGTYLDPEEL